jgi:flagellar motor component MotA
VILGLVVVLALGVVRLLYQPVTLDSYRMLDPQTLVIIGVGAPGAWTSVSDVTETQSTITMSVNAFTFEPFPHTDSGAQIEVQVHLRAPLGSRTVVDGNTGQELPETGG